MPIIHTNNHNSLKTLPTSFYDIAFGDRRFDVRLKDRDFVIGGTIDFLEWKGEFTGRCIHAKITYILDDEHYCLNGYVILGFEILALLGNF